jgi:serine/threonine protein kinase
MPIHDEPTLAALQKASSPLMYCPTCAASFSSFADACPHDGSRLIQWDPLGDPLVGETLDGRYRVVDCLAVGDASILYRGVQLAIDRPIAIKVLRLSDEAVSAGRFLREAQILKELRHPNIVCIFDVGRTETGELYFILELLRGKTLDAELVRIGRFDAHRTCEIAIQLCDALTAAHSLGIVHRDLNPSNIMLLEDDALHDLVKVLDFGLARSGSLAREDAVLTLAGSMVGTPRYTAPEALFAKGTVDPRSDLYSLGCVLRIMLAGRPDQRFVFDRQPAEALSLPADVPRTIAELVIALLAQAPEHRPDAPTVARSLQRWLDIERAQRACAEADTLVLNAWLPVADRPTLVAVAPAPAPAPIAHRMLPPTPLIAQPVLRFERPWPEATHPPPVATTHPRTITARQLPQARPTSPAPADTTHLVIPLRWLLVAAMVLVAAIAALLIGILWP